MGKAHRATGNPRGRPPLDHRPSDGGTVRKRRIRTNLRQGQSKGYSLLLSAEGLRMRPSPCSPWLWRMLPSFRDSRDSRDRITI